MLAYFGRFCGCVKKEFEFFTAYLLCQFFPQVKKVEESPQSNSYLDNELESAEAFGNKVRDPEGKITSINSKNIPIDNGIFLYFSRFLFCIFMYTTLLD